MCLYIYILYKNAQPQQYLYIYRYRSVETFINIYIYTEILQTSDSSNRLSSRSQKSFDQSTVHIS